MKDFKKPHSFGKKDFGTRPSFGSKRGPSSFDSHADRSTESHQATCDGCHKPCQVPFIPNGKKPVFCRNCFKGKETTTSFMGQPFSSATESTRGGGDVDDLKKQFSILNTKLDQLISVIEAHTRALSSTEE